MRSAERVRIARMAAGLSQAELASEVGVSRQSIAGIEAGSFDPSLRVALALAEALGSTVEELFGAESSEPPPVEATVLEGPGRREVSPQRADVASAPAGLVAVPRHGDGGLALGFQATNAHVLPEPASGLTVRLRPTRAGLPGIVIAGCDPALGLLVSVLARHDPPVEAVWVHSTSSEALALLRMGLVSIAGYHQPEEEPLQVPPGSLVVAFAAWREGLCTRPGQEADVRELARSRRLVNRQVGSEARRLLDATFAGAGIVPTDVDGYRTEVRSHLQVASAVAAGLGDVGVTIEPAAVDFGLGFTPLARERFVLAFAPSLAGSPELAATLRTCAGDELREQLAALPGYLDVDRSGEPLAGAS